METCVEGNNLVIGLKTKLTNVPTVPDAGCDDKETICKLN